MLTELNDKAREIIDFGRYAAQNKWCLATSGNFSTRLSNNSILMTGSGLEKGQLTEEDLLTVNLNGQPINSNKKPSAETLLHTALYELDPSINAVLHTHSVASTTLSRHTKNTCIVLGNYEMLKALRGITTHEASIEIPIFPNTQDMTALAEIVKLNWSALKNGYAFLVKGHGCYSWGANMIEAKRHLDALEFLFSCELQMLRV